MCRLLSESLVKLLTGGDTVSARFLYASDFEYKPTYKVWLSTNHKPVIRGTYEGIWRRICLIPFEQTIPEQQWDRQLAKKLEAELPGIFNWVLEGLMDWKQHGLSPPKKVSTAVQEYRTEQDVLQGFIDENITTKEGERIAAGKLYECFKSYCEHNNQFVLNSTQFGMRMSDKGYFKQKSGGYVYYTGVSLADSS